MKRPDAGVFPAAGLEDRKREMAGLRGHSITAHTEIVIRSSPEAIWDFASDPRNWTASNPREHFGLRYDNPENRPASGTTFRQKESVGGVVGELRGRVLYARRPEVAVWSGVATYPLLGSLLHLRVAEGGLLSLERLEGETRLSHDVFMDFPPTVLGRLAFSRFRRSGRGEKAVFDHTYRELEFFKRVESAGREVP